MESTIRLAEICHGRSGDKGNHANIGLFAYTAAGYEWLRQNLTEDKVQQYFARLEPTKVIRYEAPKLLGFNFLLFDVLGGGASRSLRTDSQGKALAVALMDMKIRSPANVDAMVRPKRKAFP